MTRRGETTRDLLRWLLAVIFAGVGVVHVLQPGVFLPIVPDWVPVPRLTIQATGACEVAGAIGLLTRRLRRLAGIMLALYAVCVYPANIKHAVDNVPVNGVHLGLWYHVPRLAFQPVIVWWALFCGEVTSWPFAKSSAGARRGD
jgi:uncharacterized membrane protein